jgi:hypothetical protein
VWNKSSFAGCYEVQFKEPSGLSRLLKARISPNPEAFPDVALYSWRRLVIISRTRLGLSCGSLLGFYSCEKTRPMVKEAGVYVMELGKRLIVSGDEMTDLFRA